MDNTEEVWKDIVGWEGMYQASNLGRVKSLSRLVKSKHGTMFMKKETVLKAGKTRTGYLKLGLYRNGKVTYLQVHQLVAMAFLNHTPCGYDLVVNHINFDPLDNRVENLEVVTQRENANKKHLKSRSKYVGVYFCKRSKKWKARIVQDGVRLNLGSFLAEIDAHYAYKTALSVISSGEKIPYKKRTPSSSYKGVYFSKTPNRWVACDKRKFIGTFKTESEAINAHKRAQNECKLTTT